MTAAAPEAAPPAAAAPPPPQLESIRIKSRHYTTWYLWDVLPDADSEKFKKLTIRAQTVVAEHKAGQSKCSPIDVFRCYAAQGLGWREHTIREPAFWAPLAGLQKAEGPGGPPAQVFSFQVGASGNLARSLVGAHAVAALPAASGACEYALVLVCGYDPATQTYVVLHTPNGADFSVLEAQHKLVGTQDAGLVASAKAAAASAAAIAATADDEDLPVVELPPGGGGSLLRPRYFHSVPASHVAPYPGRSFVYEYKKGQEVLARWEGVETLTEPTPIYWRQADWGANEEGVAVLRPRKTVQAPRWTSLLYPAEVVGGEGVEYLTVRYLSGTDADKVYKVHKKDVALAPDKGEPDENERKRQRKARKKRDEERKKREDELATAGAAAAAAKSEAAVVALPMAAVSVLASAACVGIDAAPCLATTAAMAAATGTGMASASERGGAAAGAPAAAASTSQKAGDKRGRADAEGDPSAKQRKLGGGGAAGAGTLAGAGSQAARRSPLPAGVAAARAGAKSPIKLDVNSAAAGPSGSEAARGPSPAAGGASAAARRSPIPNAAARSATSSSAAKAPAPPSQAPAPLPPPPPEPPASPGRVQPIPIMTWSEEDAAARAAEQALVQPPRGSYDADVPGAYEKDLQSWRALLGLDGPLRPARGPPAAPLPALAAAASVGGRNGGEQKPMRFGLSAPKKRMPVATSSAAGFSMEEAD